MSSILGVDLGSATMAFAILRDGKYVKSWCVRVQFTEKEIKQNPDIEQNVFLLVHNAVLEALRIWESECLIDNNEDFLCFENIPMRFGWARILIEIVGVVKVICGQRGLGFMEISPTTVKKRILGSGKSPANQKEKKQLMVDCINEKYGLSIEDHNIADAIAIGLTAYLLEGE